MMLRVALLTSIFAAFAKGQTIYGVLGDGLTTWSPLPVATFLSVSGESSVYTVASTSSLTVDQFPGATYTTSYANPIFGPGHTITSTREYESFITPPITHTITTTNAQGSTVTTTSVQYDTTSYSTLTTTTQDVTSTSWNTQPATSTAFPIVIPSGTVAVNANGTRVLHRWYQIHDINYYDDCEIYPELGTGKCHYYKIFGGATLQDVTYTGKVVPFYTATGAPATTT